MNILLKIITPFALITCAFAQQNSPYTIKFSQEFSSPKKHAIMHPIAYGKDGIIQINAKRTESFSFQLFNSDLKLVKENTVSTEGKLNERVNYQNFVKFENKTYLMVRDVFKETENEGISALEFIPSKMDFAGNSRNLFKSSGRVRMYSYSFYKSENEINFLYTYELVSKDRRDKYNKDIIGMYVFDENLGKIWGAEVEMPYTESKMDNWGYTLGDDGTVYMLAKVFNDDTRKEHTDGLPNYHFEVIMFNAQNTKPKIIKVSLDNYFIKEAYIYENEKHEIFVTGFYSKLLNKPIDGAYMFTINTAQGIAMKPEAGHYEFPSEIIKSFMSEREKRKTEKKEAKEQDLGIDYLKIRNIYKMSNGSTTIISEQFHTVTHTYYNGRTTQTTYDTYAEDIFLMNIDAAGKMKWVKKIPKAQHSNDAYGPQLSFKSMAIDNSIHIFFVDNLKNLNLPPTEAPKWHDQGRGGFLTAVKIDENGEQNKYNLGEIEKYETNFYIRYFIDGGSNNIISTERKRKMNTIYSIELK